MVKITHRININIADIRLKGKFKSERKTQALYNEPVELLKTDSKYSLVRLYDGHKGYVSKLFISENYRQEGDDYLIRATLAPAYAGPDTLSPVVTLLPFAAEITGIQDAGFLKSQSPRYGEIFLNCADLILAVEAPALTRDTIPEMIACAMRFMGVPYLWGGRSFFGVDCSGFVHVIFKYFGVPIPRKSKAQAKFGRKVTQPEIQPGDLLFFRKHVGIAINKTDYLHSSLSQGGVRINTLDHTKKDYLRYRDLTLRAVRRYIKD